MRYRKMNSEQLKKYYGQFAKPKEDGRGMIVPRGGKNRGANGKPNIRFHFDFCGVLLDTSGNEVDLTKGLVIKDLIADFYDGFGDDAVMVPGSKMMHDRHSSQTRNFHVTLDPTKVSHVLIGRKRYQDIDQITTELCDLAEFRCLGELAPDDEYCWDYFVFAWMVDYNKVANRDDKFLSDAKFAACDRSSQRRESLRYFLQEQFGSLETLKALRENLDAKTLKADVDKAHQKAELAQATPEDSLSQLRFQWNYKDEMRHKETFVLDCEGCLVAPDQSLPWDGASRYRAAERSLNDNWEYLPEGCLVLRYVRTGISVAAEYTFLQRPQEITAAQCDTIALLEQKLRNEVRQLLENYDLIDRLALRGPDSTWSQQLHDETIMAKIRKN